MDKDLGYVYQSIDDPKAHWVEYKGKFYNDRHGGPWDRGSADSWYRRPARPHFYRGASLQSDIIEKKDMSTQEIEAYYAGYEYNEEMGFHK